MSFELKTQIDTEGKEIEIIEESITKTDTTVKHWSKEQLQNEIINLKKEIVNIDLRISVLQEQLARFDK